MHLNCRGLSSNWEKFNDYLCDIHSDEFSSDYIGISEVFRCDREQRISLPGHHDIITRCRESTDDYRGGVALFIKETIDYKIRKDLSVFIPHVYESLFVEVTSNCGKNTIIGVIYRHNTFPLADIDRFTTTLFGVLDIINSENKKSIIMGDMNIDMLKYGSNDRTDVYIYIKLHLKKLKNPTQTNIFEYKTYVKAFNKIKRKAKINYFKTILEENKSNTKQIWKVLKKAIGKENNKKNFPQSFNIENKTVSDQDEIANSFNSFFANIEYKVNNSGPKSNKNCRDYMPHLNTHSIFLDPVIPADILTIVNKLKPKTSYGEDGISAKLLSKTIDKIIDPITHIVNLTFETGIFPVLKLFQFLKQVTPVY